MCNVNKDIGPTACVERIGARGVSGECQAGRQQ
jgi:hypothetical protein